MFGHLDLTLLGDPRVSTFSENCQEFKNVSINICTCIEFLIVIYCELMRCYHTIYFFIPLMFSLQMKQKSNLISGRHKLELRVECWELSI